MSTTASSAAPLPSAAQEMRAPWRLRLGFVAVPLAHSAGANIVTLLAFRFMTDNLAIPAALAGTLFAIMKIYDGVLDPALGAFSDRLHSRWGRRLPFIAGGAVAMPLAIVMLFTAHDFGSATGMVALLTVALLLHATAYTALTIPGMAMLVEASNDYHQRSTLMAYRVFGNSLGVLVGSTLPAFLLSYWGATRTGHERMAMVVAGVVLLVGCLAVHVLRDAPRTVPNATEARRRYRIFEQFRLVWANRPFRILATAHVFVLLGTAMTSVASSYFTRYVLLRADSWLGTFYMMSTVGVVGSMPLWLRVSRRVGKKRSYIAAMAAFGILHLTWLLSDSTESYWLLLLRALLLGVASGGVILFAYSMLSDAVRYDFMTSRQRREGAFSGLTSLLDKVSAAASIAGLGAYLSAAGYVSSRSGAQAVQSAQAIKSLYVCYAVLPAVAMLLAILVVMRYQLDEASLHVSHERPGS